jgi:hypothetical protein
MPAETHKTFKEEFGDDALGRMNGYSVSRTDRCQSMMMSVLDDL